MVNHTIRNALRGAGHTSTLEPLVFDLNPGKDNPELHTNQLVYSGEST